MIEESLRSRNKRIRAPDGGWGWVVVFGSFMIHVITDGVTYSFGIFYDEFLTYFNEGKGPTSWILSILVGVTLCSGPISGWMVNRWGCRTVTIVGSILASICMMISIWANSIIILYFTIGIGAGLGFGLIYLPAIVSVSTYFESKRSLATGIAVCGSGFGTFIFAPLITILLEAYGWRGAMLIIAAIVLTCTVFGILFKPLKATEILSENDVIILKSANGDTSLNISSSFSNCYLASSSGNTMQRAWSSGDINDKLTKYGTIGNEIFISSTKSEGYTNKRFPNLAARPDLIYQGSLYNIPLLATSTKSIEESKDSGIRDMLNLNLLKDPIFIVFSISNFLTSIGFNVPYVYIVSRAKSMGISSQQAGLILAVIGIANTIGRIILGYFSDKVWVNRLIVYNVCLTICGIATALSCFCFDFYSLAFYGSVFGFTIGAYVGLTSVILVDLLGLDNLTNAFGLLLLFQGIASLIGPPIAGWLYDYVNSYDPGFYVAGVTIALSGIILFIIPCLQKSLEKKKHDQREYLL
ncbi:PREDICTED: monocarboxylate transporter 12 [Nicrophorus vespilloides]|uniref:Monocarboxylate transporter 12 n=1 Tax=Nicrophorus vespilloides TaxID=110193 RepID=A0ABM1M0G8_NICVS|nr:PREDICTED: monocarboxylate transporter 12 [Nicrophorus vespilloides]XP_017768068.1 PREDICTED: monocarboxylate transporter 12 [Nicrophorus vespilloides]